jgi:hypothetical protein
VSPDDVLAELVELRRVVAAQAERITELERLDDVIGEWQATS